jgi:hypothetical protein
MIDAADKRSEMIERLEEALAVAEDLRDGQTGLSVNALGRLAENSYVRLAPPKASST